MGRACRAYATTIAGAAKVSGKTKNGLSVGILDSYTVDESVNYYDATEGSEGNISIEPAANYFVGRIRQDMRNKDAQVGGFVSSVNRMMNDSYLDDYIHDAAYQVGADAQYYWDNRNWGASGVLALSSVQGSQSAITRTQQTFGQICKKSAGTQCFKGYR